MTASLHAGAEGADQKVIGLVDELDDPSPGHLSDHPQALTSTTTATDMTKPVYKSLEDRFTKGEEGGGGAAKVSTEEAAAGGSGRASGDGMVVDEEGSDDKENKGT